METAREQVAASAAHEPGTFSDPRNEGRAQDSSFGFAESDAGAIARKKSWLRRELWLTSAGVCLTLLGAVMLGFDVGGILLQRFRSRSVPGFIEHAAFLLLVYYFVYANLIYLLARSGHLCRRRDHVPASRGELESIYGCEQPPSLTVLVPSYKEERDVVLQTLLSAGLMEYPTRRVVLLIDDPPKPADPESARQLARMRRLPHEVDQMLETPRRRFASALAAFQLRAGGGSLDFRSERKRLADFYREAGYWFEKIASSFEVRDHTDQMFVERILRRPAQEHFARAGEIVSKPLAELSAAGLLREYRRLAGLFAARFLAFERKRYVNLSHASNKAMNLNSYISLIGKSFRVLRQPCGVHLEECAPRDADFSVPASDYLITLDADSLLLNDYAMRLVHFMEQPGNQRVAVAQTPYSAVPGSPILIERIAGATTDIQHIIHQGFTWVGATYWVGANALLRRCALDDIAEVAEERGYRVTKYIQDRTVIEDTESSVDLIARGWGLYNYPDRLAYSATPPDFGALVIQRRRWANGGLIILPKLLRYLTSATQAWRKVPEASMRVHYLTSLTGVSVGMLVLLSYPFENDMRSWWLALTAAPYYFLYARDLVISGYRWTDWPRVWALNLLLIPVHLGGIFKSLHQAFTGHATPFVRTPKVEGRTTAPLLYILGALGMFALCLISGVIDVVGCQLIGAKGDDWLHLAFAVFNGTLVLYAIVYFIGLQAVWEDLGLAGRSGEALTRSPRILASEAD